MCLFHYTLDTRGSRSAASSRCSSWSPRLSLQGQHVSNRAFLRSRTRPLQPQRLVFSNLRWRHNRRQPPCPRVLSSPSRLQLEAPQQRVNTSEPAEPHRHHRNHRLRTSRNSHVRLSQYQLNRNRRLQVQQVLRRSPARPSLPQHHRSRYRRF